MLKDQGLEEVIESLDTAPAGGTAPPVGETGVTSDAVPNNMLENQTE